jgi:hypothetical protein
VRCWPDLSPLCPNLNPTVSWFRKWNYVSHRNIFLTAITRSKRKHETALVNRICRLRFCARSNPGCVGNAEREPECPYNHH